ncbi:tail fiber domain-containing protein [Thiothrix subterranea]|uniref:tail fiber domain-containing protein n=1 Tax=Thiothrix subterranea TaxID=2735563 RepID=UPI00192A78E9|nr:tail fiber domain-containing protein [Thiothrix subterranea]QQZ28512.1 tail fiber domain-containing protein [Thiothrix subterranea]
MNTKKILLAATIQSILCAAPAFAGDVEISLPAAADAFTVDQPAGTELMRVNGDGNVGIGTATPARTLDIVDATAIDNDAAVWITQNASSEHTLTVSGSDVLTQNTGLYLRTQKVGTIKTGNGAELRLGAGNRTDYLNIMPSGNIGIGTTVPSNGTANGGKVLKLDVEGAIGASSYCDENGENCKTILQLAGGGGTADNLGNHTATQNIDLAANKLVGNGGTEGIVIDATGNVGIGTTAPTSLLHVEKDHAGMTAIVVGNPNTGADASARLGVANASKTALLAMNSPNATLNPNSATLFTNADKLIIAPGGDDATRAIHLTGSLNSLSNGLTVHSSTGNIGIGTVTPTEKVDVRGGNVRIESTNLFELQNVANGMGYDIGYGVGTTLMSQNHINYVIDSVDNGTTGAHKFLTRSAGATVELLKILENGNATLKGTLTQSSDERLKEEIKPVSDALEKVKQLQGVTFKWKDAKNNDTDTQLGLIAQQVEKVMPEVVETTDDADKTKSVAYANLVALLIEGMKEQQAQIDAQQQRIDALEAKLK